MANIQKNKKNNRNNSSESGTIPSQLNINSIIKARVLIADKVIDVIINKASIHNYDQNTLNNLKQYNAVLETVFGDSGIIARINNVINVVKPKKTFALLFTLKLLSKMFVLLNNVIDNLKRQIRIDKKTTETFENLNNIFENIKETFENIINTKVLFAFTKLVLLKGGIRAIKSFLDTFDKMKVKKTMITKAILLKSIFKSMVDVFLMISISVPILIIGSVGLLIFVGAAFLLKWVLNTIGNILTKIATNIKILIGFSVMLAIIGMMALIAVAMLGLAATAKYVVKNSLWLLGFFVVLTITIAYITVISVLIGALVVATEGIAAAIIGVGMGMMISMISAMLVMGLMLKLLEVIKIDRKKIKQTVADIVDCVSAIMTALFFGPEFVSEKNDKPWVMSVLKHMGTFAMSTLSAVASIGFLGTALASIGLIMLLASQLILLQKITNSLKKNDVKAGVNNVMDCANSAVLAVLVGPTPEDKKSKPGWVGSIIKAVVAKGAAFGFLFSGIGPAIMGAYIGTIVGALGLIILLSTLLKAIQQFTKSLATDAVKAGVNNVMDCANSAMLAVLIGPTPKEDGNKKGWASSFIKSLVGKIAAIGLITSAIGPMMIYSYIGTIMGALGLILLLSTLLKAIQKVTNKLDTASIKSSVWNIIDCAHEAMLAILIGNKDKLEDTPNKDSWQVNLTKQILKSSMTIPLLGSLLVPMIYFQALSNIIGTLGLILALSAMLKGIQKVTNELDTESVKESVWHVIECATSAMSALFMPPIQKPNESKESWIKNMINHMHGISAALVAPILAVSFIGTSIAVIGLITLLAGELKIIQKLINELNTDAVKSGIWNVLNCASTAMSALFMPPEQKPNESKEGWLKSLIQHAAGVAFATTLVGPIMAVGFLATAIGTILLLTLLAGQLKLLSKIDFGADTIQTKVQSIINACQAVTDSIFHRNDTISNNGADEKKTGILRSIIDGSKGLLGGLNTGIEFIASTGWLSSALISVGMVAALAGYIRTINDLPDLTDVDKKTISICTVADNIINSITAPSTVKIAKDNRIDLLKRITSIIGDLNTINSDTVENTSQQIDNYIRFIDKVNTVDVTKLETSTKMFEQMSRFSTSIKGDFDKLAESLAEKLLPVLEELKEVMGVLPEKIDVGFQNTSASIAATNAPATKENITAQVNREKPNASVEDVAIEVASRMNEKAKADANGIAAKLDELISMFKGYGEIARVQITT